MKLCPKCQNKFIKNSAKQCLECYRKTCVVHKPICKCGKVLSNYNNKMCRKCADKTKRKKIAQLDKKGNHLAVWESINQVVRLLGLSQSSLVHCLKGRRNMVNNFKWKYV